MALQLFQTRMGKYTLAMLFSAFLLVSAPTMTYAEEPAAEGATEELDPRLVFNRVTAGFLKDFGFSYGMAWFFQWIIIVSFSTGIGIAAERYYAIVMKSKVNMQKFTDQLIKYVEAKDYDRAIQLCNASPSGALPLLSKAGLEAAKRNMGARAVQDSIDEETLKLMPTITNRLPWVATLANTSTMMGLMGTIFGLMYTFAGLDLVLNPKAQAAHLSKGIATAMNTTLLGLMTAVPLTIIAGYLNAASKSLVDDIDENSVRLINALSRS